MAKGEVKVSSKSTSKSVTLKKADNGYVVSSWGDGMGKERIKIAKDLPEAKKSPRRC